MPTSCHSWDQLLALKILLVLLVHGKVIHFGFSLNAKNSIPIISPFYTINEGSISWTFLHNWHSVLLKKLGAIMQSYMLCLCSCSHCHPVATNRIYPSSKECNSKKWCKERHLQFLSCPPDQCVVCLLKQSMLAALVLFHESASQVLAVAVFFSPNDDNN